MKEMIESRKASRGQGGFTLIELLVVIAILAVLAGVAVFAVNGLTTDADVNACKVEKSTMLTANQASVAAGDTLVSDHLEDSNITATGGVVTGKYWSMSDNAVDPNPISKLPDAPADCS